MKKTLLSLLAIATLVSCRSLVPLQGKYQDVPVKSKFQISYDKVWEKVIDYISDTGQEVQLIDKVSGIIISDVNIASGTLLSHEDKRGKIINSVAYVAVERYNDDFPKGELPIHRAIAKWTIRVKELQPGETVVAVLLHVKDVQQGILKDVDHFRGKSTGNYEKVMLNEIIDRIEK